MTRRPRLPWWLACACFAHGLALLAQQPMVDGLLSHPPLPQELRTQGLAPLPCNLYGRERVDLSGTWQFLVDSVERGLRNQYPRYTIPKDEKQAPVGGPLVEYDWDSAPDITVPGDWNTQSNERLFWYEGLGWYRRRFPAPPTSGDRRYFLYFEAANYRAHVYLNGSPLGVHEGGFTPFAFEVTDKLVSDNSLVVGVNNRRQYGNVPGSDADWFNYGGITRPVWLVSTPPTFIQHAVVTLRDAETGPIITCTVTLDGRDAADTPVTLRIPELAIELDATTGADGRATIELPAPRHLERWSPETPRLYPIVLSTAEDTIADRIGFRTIATRGHDVLLNGRSIYLRGISIHEERLGTREDDGGRRLDWDDSRRLLTEARALGCNFVRLAHYPHSEKTTRLCDELGLLVWSEIPVYQEDIAYDDPHTLEVARQMLAEIITRDQNRASVVVWSVANETPLTEPRLRFLRTLIADARAQDSTRLISAALNRSIASTLTEIVIDDPLGADLDLLAYNTYAGWYGPLAPGDITSITWRSIYDKPMILSEFGTDAKFGVHGVREARWTEEYQRWFYEQTIHNANTVPWIRGLSPWILKDFRSPRRYRTDYQNYWNRKGLISETGQRKLAWQVLHDFYQHQADAPAAR
ncbi:MAG: beta-glucuronidase [Opitutaceae bacterium]|nr:beta-glucuronidase [Opitutaceae bacterium]